MYYRKRLFIEKWLWSGGRLRTWFAIKLPMFVSDVDYISPRKLRRMGFFDEDLGR